MTDHPPNKPPACAPVAATMPAGSRAVAAGKPRNSTLARSRVTNGSVILNDVDGRTVAARRYRDLLDSYSATYSAMDEAASTLCRGAARLALALEEHDERKLNGLPVNDAEAARLTSRLARLLRDLATSHNRRRRGLR